MYQKLYTYINLSIFKKIYLFSPTKKMLKKIYKVPRPICLMKTSANEPKVGLSLVQGSSRRET